MREGVISDVAAAATRKPTCRFRDKYYDVFVMVDVPQPLREHYPHLWFRRHWQIGPDVHYQLGQCNTIIRAIQEAPLSPDRYRELKKVALIKGAQATTAIEGNTLTDSEVQQVAAGESLPPSKEYQEREVRNVLDAMNGIVEDIAGQQEIARVSAGLLRDFHRQIGTELGEHFDAVPGRFRTDERVVGPYRCPRAADVPLLVNLLCRWLREDFAAGENGPAFSDAVIQAVVAHVYIEWIHPFGDGNGRTGRMLEFDLLLRAGTPDIASHILSSFYNLTRPEYYRQIHRACTSRDLGAFIAYAVEGYRDGLLERLHTIQQHQFEVAWRTLIHDRFARRSYRKKHVFRRRRELMLNFPLNKTVALDRLPMLNVGLARAYARLTETTLLRDLRVLIDMNLVVRDEPDGGYRANTELLRRHLPARRK